MTSLYFNFKLYKVYRYLRLELFVYLFVVINLTISNNRVFIQAKADHLLSTRALAGVVGEGVGVGEGEKDIEFETLSDGWEGAKVWRDVGGTDLVENDINSTTTTTSITDASLNKDEDKVEENEVRGNKCP